MRWRPEERRGDDSDSDDRARHLSSTRAKKVSLLWSFVYYSRAVVCYLLEGFHFELLGCLRDDERGRGVCRQEKGMHLWPNVLLLRQALPKMQSPSLFHSLSRIHILKIYFTEAAMVDQCDARELARAKDVQQARAHGPPPRLCPMLTCIFCS